MEQLRGVSMCFGIKLVRCYRVFMYIPCPSCHTLAKQHSMFSPIYKTTKSQFHDSLLQTIKCMLKSNKPIFSSVPHNLCSGHYISNHFVLLTFKSKMITSRTIVGIIWTLPTMLCSMKMYPAPPATPWQYQMYHPWSYDDDHVGSFLSFFTSKNVFIAVQNQPV